MRYLPLMLAALWSVSVFAIDLDGETDFAQTLELNASISARVDRVVVAPGDSVVAGALLLTLVDTGFQAEVEYAQARVDGLAPVVARMTTELEKAEELFDRDSLAMVELQNAEQDQAIALANLLAAQANLRKAKFALSQTELRAPISGRVLSVQIHPGQFINTRVKDQVLLTLVDDREMIARAMLPAELWDRDLLDRPASVQLLNRSYEARVVALGQQTVIGNNNHPAIELRVRFEADGQVPARLPVKIIIENN